VPDWPGVFLRDSKLENGLTAGHIPKMGPLDKCLSVLRPLIVEGHTNGVAMAERAIDEFLAARKGALRNVREVVQTHQEATSGDERSFADKVNDYIEEKMRAFE